MDVRPGDNCRENYCTNNASQEKTWPSSVHRVPRREHINRTTTKNCAESGLEISGLVYEWKIIMRLTLRVDDRLQESILEFFHSAFRLRRSA